MYRSWLACPITSSVIEWVWAPDGSNQKLFVLNWICCFSAKHASFWRKSTHCFAQNQNNCVWVEQHAYPWIHCCNKNNLLCPHLYTFPCRHAAVIYHVSPCIALIFFYLGYTGQESDLSSACPRMAIKTLGVWVKKISFN